MINWINCIKAVCIILVFGVHSFELNGFQIPEFCFYLYGPVYVNAFFFVSGYLLFRKQLPEPLEDKKLYLSNVLFRLVIPSVLFALIEFLPKRLLRGGTVSAAALLTETVGGGTYWFISALVVAELVLFLLMLTRIRNIWFYVVCSIVLAVTGILIESSGFTVMESDPTFPWKYKQGLVSLLYLAAGGLYRQYEKDLEQPVWALVLLSLLYVAGACFLTGYIGEFSVYFCNTELSGFVWSILGIICLVEICKRMPEWAQLTFIGRNSILFYMLSGAVPTVISKLMIPLCGANAVSLLMVALLSIALTFFIVKLIVRYLPFLKDLRTLKRMDRYFR